MRNYNYLLLFGSPEDYSPGLMSVMADKQILESFHEERVDLEDVGNLKTVVRCCHSPKWFIADRGHGTDNIFTAMTGAIMGDVIGSVYEWANIKYKLKQEDLIAPHARFTDDTVMTCAVANGLRVGLEKLPSQWMDYPGSDSILSESVKESMLHFGRKYPGAGYGSGFMRWLWSDEPKPYNSWGNGSAMRTSYAGWVARTVEEAEKLAEIAAKVTHDHPKGIKGAKIVAGCIMMLRLNAGKDDIREYVAKHYDMNFTLDEIRNEYRFDASCEGTVPYAIMAFLEGESFVDVIANAISIGGDSDTLAAIAGSIAEVIYPIPQSIRSEVLSRVDEPLLQAIADSVDFFYKRLP